MLAVLAFFVGIPLLSGYFHDEDLAALELSAPAFWTHLGGRKGPALLAFVLMLILFIPQRLFEPPKSDLLMQFRYPLVLGLPTWLIALSVVRPMIPAKKGRALVSGGPAAP